MLKMAKLIFSLLVLIFMQLSTIKAASHGYSYPKPTEPFNPQIPDNFHPHGVEPPPNKNEVEDFSPPQSNQPDKNPREYSSEEEFDDVPVISIANSDNRLTSQRLTQPGLFPTFYHDSQRFYQYFP